MLKIENLYKTYNAGKKTALENFSINVEEASVYGLLGPNGAGKTSLIRIINQITQQDSGEVYIWGEKLQQKHIRNIGYMPEERGLYKNMTVGDQLIYFGELKGMTRNQVLEQAKYWFQQLEIDQWWKKKLSELSKGMAQKIQFVVTVLHQPKLLILDEPFSGFDPVNANLIKDQILNLKKNGTTIILSTHRMESVEEMCDRVALINQAKKIIDGDVWSVREQFKENLYQIQLSQVDTEKISEFAKQYSFDYKHLKNQIIGFDVKIEGNKNDFVRELMQVGYLESFVEKIPSMNEVFIQAVQTKS